MIVLVDLDGVLANLHPAWLARCVACCPPAGEARLSEVLRSWDGFLQLPCGDHALDHLDHDLFYDLDPIPGALDAILELEEAGHDVVALTASSLDPQSAAAKLSWCERKLGWSRHRVIVAQRKELVRGDVLIDDSPDNLGAWTKANPAGVGLSIRYPYSGPAESMERVLMFDDWTRTELAWKQIVQCVSDFERHGRP